MVRFLLAIIVVPGFLLAQSPVQPGASEIKNNLKKLNFLGSVLYVAAHPDDENTRVITYLSQGKLATAGYLSLTRGDGGQNLVGPELRDLLGLIRTQELLAARRLDGGRQFFTRANDFGYSKSADETLAIWGKDEILSDVVKVYRQYQPDVILTRFPPDDRAGHGHHTASAMLAIEAFDAAAKANMYPEQVKYFGIWQPKRLFTNTGRWWNNTISESTPGVITMNVGGYNALLGESYSEIAATSRSQHKSQGFGSRKVRGDQVEYFEFVKGDTAQKDIFEGINTTWTRVTGGEKVKLLVDRAIKEFNVDDPATLVPLLLDIRKQIASLEKNVWTTRKLTEVDKLIEDSLGLYLEVSATNFYATPGEHIVPNFELLNRSEIDVKIEKISAPNLQYDTTLNASLKNNIPLSFKTRQTIIPTQQYSDPYWLKEPHGLGRFTVENADLIGKPEDDPALYITFTLSIAGEKFLTKKPVIYRWTDPVKGELYRPFEIVPPVVVKIVNGVWIFNSGEPKDITVIVKSISDNAMTGVVKLDLPTGWKSDPGTINFTLSKRDEEQTKTFKVFPAAIESTSKLRAIVEVNGKLFNRSLQNIQYDHIPTQTLLPLAEAPLIRIDLKRAGNVIGYIKGAGDDVPAALRNIGYEVWEMKDEEVTAENLKRVDAVVLGIRALNTNERIGFMMRDLLEYVKSGGTMVVQYNTNHDLETDKYAPYPLTLSRDRVTEEDATVRILKPDHPLFNFPNKITPHDFDGWVQERGLYFPNKWDDQYEALLSMNDTGESPKDGSLLVAKYGKGYYIYTGLSFFRELPEGVAGAYKLLVNMVSIGKSQKPENTKIKNKSK